MDWTNVLSIQPNELTAGVLEAIPYHLSSIDVNELSEDELRKFFELNRFLINRLSNDTKKKKTLAKGQYINDDAKKMLHKMLTNFIEFTPYLPLDLNADKNLAKDSAADESYYIQTIQEVSVRNSHFFLLLL